MAAQTKIAPTIKLNLGCCDNHMKGFTNVDRCEPADQVVNLEGSWPWPDSSVSFINAWDIFEHLESKIRTMNEAHRVLGPGCNLDLKVPTTDGRGAFQDPTHKSFWTPNDLWYFCEPYAEWARFRKHYGITAHFRIISQSHQELGAKIWKLHAVLQAVKA